MAKMGTKEWANEWCYSFLSRVEKKLDDCIDGCDVCPHTDRCSFEHNGLLDWWEATLKEYEKEKCVNIQK